MSFDIYISSSWKERDRVRALAHHLRQEGFSVYDFTDPECRQTEEIPPEKFSEQFDPHKHIYAKYLDKPEWRDAVENNQQVLDECRAVVLLLPCGIDATADWAYAVGKGKLTLVLGHPGAGERSPVHLWADMMTQSYTTAINWLKAQLQGTP